MTGGQGNPFNGETLQKRPSRELDLEGVRARARRGGRAHGGPLGPEGRADRALKEAVGLPTRSRCWCSAARACCWSACARRPMRWATPARPAACASTLGCPAIAKDAETGRASIDAGLCIGCGQCAQYCAFRRHLEVPPFCRTAATADAAASPSTRSRSVDGGLRAEARGASATESISGTGETLADLGGPAAGGTSAVPSISGTGETLADFGGPAAEGGGNADADAAEANGGSHE